MKRLHLACLVAGLGAVACNGTTPGDGGVDSGLLDICNDAGTDPICELQVSVLDGGSDGGLTCQKFYIDHVKKQLWLWFDVPAAAAPQSLFEIFASYTVPATPVQLALNVLSADQKTSIGSAVANATGAPKPIQLVLVIPDGGTGAQYFVQASDASNSHADVHNPFEICASLFPDPDRNVPGVPTPVTLSGPDGAGVQTGSCLGTPCTGVLSVEGRVDQFTLTIPAGISRPILYVNLSAPGSQGLTPPMAYLPAFQLLDSASNIVFENFVPNVFLAVDLSTAQLVKPGETYTVRVLGLPPGDLNGFGDLQAAPGDPRLTYTVTANVMPDADTNEPDDNLAQAHPVQFSSLGSTQNITGRIGYVGDQDWYAIQIPATGNATRLHYKVTGTGNGGRYPPIFDEVGHQALPNADRDIELTKLVAGQPVCMQDQVQCPRDPLVIGTQTEADLLRTSLCAGGVSGDGGALCLLSFREEGTSELAHFASLQNFEGIIPIPPPQGGPATYYLTYQSFSGAYADDLDYSIKLDWEAEGPENQNGYHDTIATAIPYGTLSSGSYPEPPATGVSGVLTTGYGYLQSQNYRQLDLSLEQPPFDVRGPQDYDATPSTADTYEVDFPASYVSTPGYGATWELNWTVTGASGAPAEDLLLQVQFCTMVSGILSCNASGPSGPSGVPGAFGYSAGDFDPWWRDADRNYVTADIPPIFQQIGTEVLAAPAGCFCFNPAFLEAGKFYVTVLGADRTAWTDSDYTLNMGITSYPQTFGLDSGVTYSCPYTPVASDGGLLDAGTKIPGCEFVQGF